MTATATYLIAIALAALVLEHAATHVDNREFGAILRCVALAACAVILVAPWVLPTP